MEITFSDPKVRDLCCSKAELVRRFGATLAKKICCRLSVLSAAPSLADVPSTLPIGLTRVNGHGDFSVALGVEHRLLFQGVPLDAARAGELARINQIQIVGSAPVLAVKGKKQ